MQFISILSFVTLTVYAIIGGDCKPGRQTSSTVGITHLRSPRSAIEYRGTASSFKDMLLYNIYTHSFRDINGSLKRAATFAWDDPNSNTSTCCTTSWSDSTNSTNFPTSYIFCDTTGNPETWQWYFSSYVSGSNFTLQLAHQFQDAAQFPPPWDTPIFFSATAVKLVCIHKHGLEGCYLPRNEKIVQAVVNGISD